MKQTICRCDLEFEDLRQLPDECGTFRFNVRLVKCPLCSASEDLLKSAHAAWHLCSSLLAWHAAWHLCSSLLACPGATPELISEIRDSLKSAIEKAEAPS